MHLFINKLIKTAVIFSVAVSCFGCAVKFQKHHPKDIKTIQELSEELQELNQTMALLKEKLKEEISRGDVSVKQEDRGIVVTFVAEILFDSGRAEVKKEGLDILEKIADVLKQVNNDVSIEGHTDDIPIKFSGWKSNWELSSARALGVLHYLVDEKQLNAVHFSATGFGEFRPVTTNDTKEGRQKNRRVEIIIRPRLSMKDSNKRDNVSKKDKTTDVKLDKAVERPSAAKELKTEKDSASQDSMNKKDKTTDVKLDKAVERPSAAKELKTEKDSASQDSMNKKDKTTDVKLDKAVEKPNVMEALETEHAGTEEDAAAKDIGSK